MRQVIVDTETTGLSPHEGHRIIEIGCIELINRRITGKRYHQYLNPERDVESEALAVHGITREFLNDKPLFAAVATEFMDFLAGAELIIHNAPFDVGFIDHEFALTTGKWKKIADCCQITDTLLLARQHHPGQRNSLDALCKRYGIDNSRRELHGALLDAHLLAQVYLAMTGGQASLFDLSGATESAAVQTEKNITEKIISNPESETSLPLRVIQADETELALHLQKITAMHQQGKCLYSGLSTIPTEFTQQDQ